MFPYQYRNWFRVLEPAKRTCPEVLFPSLGGSVDVRGFQRSGSRRTGAAIMLLNDGRVDINAVLGHCRERLADFKVPNMSPHARSRCHEARAARW